MHLQARASPGMGFPAEAAAVERSIMYAYQRICGIGFAALFCMGVGPVVARGQCVANELHALIAADGAPVDVFANSIAIDDDWAIVGVWADDDNGPTSGSVYLFEYDGVAWQRRQKLVTPDGVDFDYYGVSVGLSGDTAVVGAPGEDDLGGESGSVYVYERGVDAWEFVTKLHPQDLAADDHFGTSVAICGDTLLSGAWTEDPGGVSSGSAYVFRRVAGVWVEEQKLVPDDAEAYDWVGFAVALDGETAVVGAPFDDDLGNKSGAAYVFEHEAGGWNQIAKLTADDGEAEAHFGDVLAIDGEVVLVGAHMHAGGDGAAYVFRQDGSGWVQEQKLVPAALGMWDNFGYSVAVDGNVALIGAVLDDEDGENSGAAYAFQFDGVVWNEVAALRASDAGPFDYFGVSAALQGAHGMIGAWAEDDEGGNLGLGYAFGSFGDCNQNAVLDLCDIANGTSEDVDGDGVPDECTGLIGDTDCDGAVTFDDIVGLVRALSGEDVYYAYYPDCRWENADCDQDGLVTFDDIAPFVALLD